MKICEIDNKKDFSFNCIYLWTNLINGKVYVGQAHNFYSRMCRYKSGQESRRVIGKAIIKYGIDNFDISILESNIDNDRLNEREQYWMDYYQSYNTNIGYNICTKAGSTIGYKHTEEDKKKMSELKKKYLEEHPEKILRGKDNPNYGKTLSDESKQKMSERMIGNQYAKNKTWSLTEEQCETRSKNMLGRKNSLGYKHTRETKDKIANNNRNRIITEATKRKQSESHIGKTCKKVVCIETGVVYNSIKDASNETKIKHSNISHCVRGKQKTAGGYHWQYYNE